MASWPAGWLAQVAAAFPSLAFRGNPRGQIYEKRVPSKSPNKGQLWAAEKRLVTTVNYFISLDLQPRLNQTTQV